jgi:hypothetical protein
MRVFLAALLLGGCSSAPSGTACNGHDELCGRRYDQVAFPGTHDAYSNVAENFGAPDQSYTLTRQLNDGVRVLHFEISLYLGDAYLCHSICAIGSKLLLDGLKEVAVFSAAHPREVVTLLMESNDLTSDQLAAVMKASGLVGRLRVQPDGAAWPTLGEMIRAGERVVAFNADQTGAGGARYPWLLDRWAWTWETPWDNQTPADFLRCDADRGTAGAPLYVVDTYREDQILPTAAEATSVNDNPFLLDRLLHCREAGGQPPSFVMVNYYEVGDLFADVDVLNGFAPESGDDLDAFPPAWRD